MYKAKGSRVECGRPTPSHNPTTPWAAPSHKITSFTHYGGMMRVRKGKGVSVTLNETRLMTASPGWLVLVTTLYPN